MNSLLDSSHVRPGFYPAANKWVVTFLVQFNIETVLKIWLWMTMNVGIYNNDDGNQQFSFTQSEG